MASVPQVLPLVEIWLIEFLLLLWRQMNMLAMPGSNCVCYHLKYVAILSGTCAMLKMEVCICAEAH